MSYDWEGRRTRRLQMLKFFGALVMPVIILGSAITLAEWAEKETPTFAATQTPTALR